MTFFKSGQFSRQNRNTIIHPYNNLTKSISVGNILFLPPLADRMNHMFWRTLIFRFCIRNNVVLLNSWYVALREADYYVIDPGFKDLDSSCSDNVILSHSFAVEFRVKRLNHQSNFPDNSSHAIQHVPDRHFFIIVFLATLK